MHLLNSDLKLSPIRGYTACPQPAPVTCFFSKFVQDGTDSETSHWKSPLATPIHTAHRIPQSACLA